MVREDPLWTASNEAKEKSQLLAFLSYAEEQSKRSFPDYAALHQWSIEELDAFWERWRVSFKSNSRLITPRQSPPHDHFIKVSGLQGVNLATFITLKGNLNPTKQPFYTVVKIKRRPHYLEFIVQKSKTNKRGTGGKGVQKGDVVVGYLRHHPDTIASFLATNALGGVWSCCSPDFGVESVVQRFEQLQPKVLCAHESYSHKGKVNSLKDKVEQISQKISSQPKQLLSMGP